MQGGTLGAGAGGQAANPGGNGNPGANGLLPVTPGVNGIAGLGGNAGANGSAGAIGSAGNSGTAGTNGTGGIGASAIVGTGNNIVINDGEIYGGYNFDGSVQADAIVFNGNGNRLELWNDSKIFGDVVTDGSSVNDTFALGGEENGTFDVSGLVGSATTNDGITEYEAFDKFEKVGISTWTLTNTTAQTTPWTIYNGTLSTSDDGNLGSTAGTLTIDGGIWQVTGVSYNTTTRAIVLGDTNGGSNGIEIVDPSNIFTYNNSISGSGGLVKLGDGTLAFNGVNTYTGLTQVSEGKLVIGDSIPNNSAFILGDVLVDHGAILAGHGTVGGMVENHGTIAPGNSIGTITFNGNYLQQSDGTYETEVDLNDGNDLILTHGIASLNGGHVQVLAFNGNVADDECDWYYRRTIVQTDDGVFGSYDSVSTDFVNLDPELVYTDNTVDLELYRNDIILANEGVTPNQIATGRALDREDHSGALYRAVLIAGGCDVEDSLDALSGEIHADTAAGILAGAQTSRLIVFQNLRNSMEQDPQAAPAPAYSAKGAKVPIESAAVESKRYSLWAEAVGNWQTLESDGNAAETDYSTAGIFIGGTASLGGGWYGGLSFGYTDTSLDVDDRDSSADIEGYTLAITAAKAFEIGSGKLNWLIGASYTWDTIETERDVNVGPLSEHLSAEYDAGLAQIFTEVGYAMEVAENTTLEPFVGLAWSKLDTDSFTESGGISALESDGYDNDQVTSTLGLRAQRGFTLASMPGKVRAVLAWQHSFGDESASSDVSFAGGSQFTIHGSPIAEDSALLEIGASLNLTESLTLGAAYVGRFSSENQENTARASLIWSF